MVHVLSLILDMLSESSMTVMWYHEFIVFHNIELLISHKTDRYSDFILLSFVLSDYDTEWPFTRHQLTLKSKVLKVFFLFSACSFAAALNMKETFLGAHFIKVIKRNIK